MNFIFKDANVFFDLSKDEWRFFLTFLRKTESKKFLPNDAEGYSGVEIDKKRINFYNSKLDIAISTKLGKNKSYLENDLSYIKRITKKVKKTLLYEFIYLYKGDVKLMMSRDKFQNFREFCVNSKIISCGISKVKK